MKLKRFLALLITAALLGCPAVAAENAEPPAPDDLFVLGAASEYGELPVSDNAGGAMLRRSAFIAAAADEPAADGLAVRYDPREDGFLPPIRTQGSWNTCWAVAAITAAEVDGLYHGLLSSAPEETDLSERHLIYFFSHQADDPLGNSSNDHNVSSNWWLTNGGNPIIAAMTMACWHGPADEAATDSPYGGLSKDDSIASAYAYTDELHLENTYTMDLTDAASRSALKSMILEHGGAVLCMYYDSAYRFAGSPSEEKAKPAATPEPTSEPTPEPLPEPTGEPEPTGTPDPDETAQPTEMPEPAEVPTPEPPEPPEPVEEPEENPSSDQGNPAPDVNEYIALDGIADEDDPGEPTPEDNTEDPEPTEVPEPTTEPTAAPTPTPKPEDFTVCYYQDRSSSTNHEVFVIGWDDEYPAENFGWSSMGVVPSGDGAWLCRNSQGADWSDGDGCFWVSYYDRCVSSDNNGSISGRATVFDFAAADNFDNDYEYDGSAVLGYVNDAVNGRGFSTASAAQGSTRSYANIFTAAGNDAAYGRELLRAVSTYTYRPNVDYTARVYTKLTDPSDPTSGTLAAELSGSFPYAGYHTLPLTEPVELEEGDLFAVVFRIGAAADNSLLIPSCFESSSWHAANETLSGQSFASFDGETWYDCKTLKNEPNVRIKAFTDNFVPPLAVKLAPDGGSAKVSGDYSGLYARVALVIENRGVSGLYITQAVLNPDGRIVIPAFMIPGLTVKGVSVALVPTLDDIPSPRPEAAASDFLYFS